MGLGGRESREFEREYAQILCLQDPEEVFRRSAALVVQLTGLPISSFGGLDTADEMHLRHTVNAEAFEGMVVPLGAGLGGKVLLSGRPDWVADYTASDSITHHFNRQVLVESVRGMAVVPIVHGDRVFGCLYGASRDLTVFGDEIVAALQQIADRAATAAVVVERNRRATEAALAEERRRLALELHDTVGAALFTIGAGIRGLGAELHARPGVARRIRILADQTADASVALRRSMRALSESAEQIALSTALRQDCRAFQERTGVHAALILLCDTPSLPEAVVDAVTRAVREALLNVEKHAAASSVTVSLFTAPGRLIVAVCDDGLGLAAQRTAGLGLAAAAERLSRVGGDLNVGPGDDGGVTVQAWVPMRAPASASTDLIPR